MYTSLMAIILVGVLAPVVDTADKPAENYLVNEVVKVTTADLFECTLRDYKPAKSVTFRVFLPKLETDAAEDAQKPTKESLAERLKAAEKIELRNVEFLSYFRVKADLWLDGEPYRCRPVPKTDPTEKTDGKQPSPKDTPEKPADQYLKQQLQMLKQPVPQPTPRRVTLRQLLDTKIDGSMLTDETPLSEALEILTESVQPNLPLVVLWKDLEQKALIDKDTPIGVEGFGRMKLRHILDAILHAVAGSGPDLAVVIEGKILTLGTAETLIKDKTRVYEMGDLMAPPSDGGRYDNRNGSRQGNRNNTNRTNRNTSR